MSSLRVKGGLKLSGEITPQGAKNEALQVICATLLSGNDIIISNIPNIIDVVKLIDILKSLGVEVNKLEKGKYSFNSQKIDLKYLQSQDFINDAKKLRGSIMLVGPLLARFGLASIPRPGGDKIGRRRLDTHFINLQKLGAKLDYNSENKMYSVTSSNSLEGTNILLDEASVTGTANILMASVLSKGQTTIYNAACEPYIQQLCLLLNKMDATFSDWENHITTIFTEVRLKKIIEVRGADGGPWSRVCALPAFWTGILYDEEILDEIWSIIKSWKFNEIKKFYEDVRTDGLKASAPNNESVFKFTKKIIDFSVKGLKKRNYTKGDDDETIFLEPLNIILDSGKSPAETWKNLFLGEWNNNVDMIYETNYFKVLKKNEKI